jgi:hypothetical protein
VELPSAAAKNTRAMVPRHRRRKTSSSLTIRTLHMQASARVWSCEVQASARVWSCEVQASARVWSCEVQGLAHFNKIVSS